MCANTPPSSFVSLENCTDRHIYLHEGAAPGFLLRRTEMVGGSICFIPPSIMSPVKIDRDYFYNLKKCNKRF